MDNIKKMNIAKFARNNGVILRTINLLQHKYERLTDVKYALNGINEGDFLKSVDFLSEAGYIRLRTAEGKKESNLADEKFEALEAKLTDKGIRLLSGVIDDDLVED